MWWVYASLAPGLALTALVALVQALMYLRQVTRWTALDLGPPGMTPSRATGLAMFGGMLLLMALAHADRRSHVHPRRAGLLES